MASIRVQYLGGVSAVFGGCTTVGDIMLRAAGAEQRFASDVVVLPVGSSEVLAHDRIPPPDVCVVLKKEEAELSAEECKINVTLHADAQDTATVVRALAMLQAVSPGTRWPEDMLLEAARDPAKEKSLRTLVCAGVDGSDALCNTSKHGDTATVRRLIGAGTNLDKVGGYGENALTGASKTGHKEVVQILIEARAEPNSPNQFGLSALMEVSCAGQKEVVQILIEARAEVNHIDQFGLSVLMRTCGCGHKEVVPILIDAGAEVNYAAPDSSTALSMASGGGHKEVVQILIDAEVEVDHIHRALFRAHATVLRVLIEARADIQYRNRRGDTALMQARRDGREEEAQILSDATIHL